MSSEENRIGIIYAGGVGKRLWPLSTPEDPKQVNDDIEEETLLEKTFQRSLHIFPKENIFIATKAHLVDVVKEQTGVQDDNIIVQPDESDTALAMIISTEVIARRNPDAVCVSLYSDHFVQELDQFTETVDLACQRAEENQDSIVTVGTAPYRPETQLGYVELKDALSERTYRAGSFIEKPSKEEVSTLIDNRYVWNTGLYVWKTQAARQVFSDVLGDAFDQVVSYLNAETEAEKRELIQGAHRVIPASFEKAVSEKTDKLLIVLGSYHWKDVGSWNTMYEFYPKDDNQNVILNHEHKNLVVVDSNGNLVLPSQHNVVVIGVNDLIVVQNGDSILICHKDQTDKLKEAVQKLEEGQERAAES